MATDFTRRRLLKLLPASAALAAVRPALAAIPASRFYSAANDQNDRHFLCGWSEGKLLFQVESPGRAHDVLINSATNSAIYFARRPGNWFIALNADTGSLQQQVTAPEGRHFFGHGTLIENGDLLFTTENDFARGGKGVIGVYDCRDNYRRVGEFASGGIGPHQLATMPDGKTLVVANGGILTLPQSSRDKLNIDTMQPSLCYIDSETGKLLGQWQPPHHQLSLRHLDVDARGTVTVGAQFEGPADRRFPLLYSHRGEEQLTAYEAEDRVWQAHKQYIASVSCGGDQVIATSPRGNCIGLWKNGKLQKLLHLNDVAGAVFDSSVQQFVVSNGRGQLVDIKNQQLQLLGLAGTLQWDNHMDIAPLLGHRHRGISREA